MVEILRKMMEGVNLIKIYYKHFYKCHNVYPVRYQSKNYKK
jgi:hypothetical protein